MGLQMDRRPGAADRRPRSSRSSATARPARATSTRRSSWPRRSTRPSSSSARTTSGRSPSRWRGRRRIPLYQPRRAASASPACASTATTCSPSSPSPARTLQRAREGGGPTLIEAYTYRMGAHTTSDDPTRYRADAATSRRGSSKTRSSGCARSCGASSWPTSRSSTRSRRRRRRWRCGCATACRSLPDPDAATDLRPRLRRAAPAGRGGAGAYEALPRRLRRPEGERTDDATGDRHRSRWPRRSTWACGAAMEDDPKVLLMGEDIGKLGGVFRVTDGLQKDFGEHRVIDTPLAESGIVGTGDRPGDARLPAGRGDPVRRLRLPGVRPDRVAGRQAARALARRRCRCR